MTPDAARSLERHLTRTGISVDVYVENPITWDDAEVVVKLIGATVGAAVLKKAAGEVAEWLIARTKAYFARSKQGGRSTALRMEFGRDGADSDAAPAKKRSNANRKGSKKTASKTKRPSGRKGGRFTGIG